MRVLNAAQMREADRFTINELGLSSLVLMENAGRQVVAAMEATFDTLDDMQVGVLAGRGNNGGDGFVIARTLRQRGVEVSVGLVGKVADVRGDARINLEILGRLGLTVVEIGNEQDWELHGAELLACDLIVDAMFGTGLREPLSGLLQTVVADINGSGKPVVAVDLPSGLSADTHDVVGDAVQAALTVTLAAPKLPLVMPPAESHCGDLVIADIGIPTEVIDELEGPVIELLTRDAMRELIEPARARVSQGRLRPRRHCRRVFRQDRRRPPGGSRRAQVRRRPRHGRDATVGAADRRGNGRRVHDPSSAGRGRRGLGRRPRSGAGAVRRRCRRRSRTWHRRRRTGVRPGAARASDDATRARCRRAQRHRRRLGDARRPRRSRRHHHAPSGGDGAAARHDGGAGAARSHRGGRDPSPPRARSTSSSRGTAR